jgi:hypothetical protein
MPNGEKPAALASDLGMVRHRLVIDARTYPGCKLLAAFHVIRELVETGAGRGEHDGVARTRELAAPHDRLVQRPVLLDDRPSTRDCRFDQPRIASDQQYRAAVSVDQLFQRRELCALPSPPAISTTGRCDAFERSARSPRWWSPSNR